MKYDFDEWRTDRFKAKPKLLAGSGGGGIKGGDEQGGGTATEDPDTLVSKQTARIIDVWSEGPIEGWTNATWPLKDIFFDGTPIQNNDAWGVANDGITTDNQTTFRTPTNGTVFDVFRNKKGEVKPKRSSMVGRWIWVKNASGNTITPWGCVVESVESEHSLTLSAPATESASSAQWQLGGSLNSKGFGFQYRLGTQSQSMLEGFPSAEATHEEGVPLRANWPPWQHYFYDVTLDACRVDVRFDRMVEQDPNDGDLHGSSVRLQVFLNGEMVADDTVTGKATSPYVRTYHIPFTDYPNQTRLVMVKRITPDSSEQRVQNSTAIQSYTEITYGKFRYPNTALIAMRVNAKQYTTIPVRSYRIKGLKVRIPTNYDPVTRLYDESPPWDGSLTSTLYWTDNPAWCFYDMCTNKRYGLGNMLDESSIDKFTLYQVAKYCDAINARPLNANNDYGPNGKHGVPDGKGGFEPRFTCNLYIQRHEDAIKVVQDMAGMMRSMVAYINGVVTPIQDSPADAASYRMFSPANVIDGRFNYSGVGLRARHNVAIVSWSDLNDAGRIKQEYVEDHESVAKSGAINRLELTGFGCASRSQARRIGLWAIYAEKFLTDTVTFSTGMEGYLIKPGQVIQIQDPFRAGKTLSGRIVTGSTATQLNLDRTVTLDAGATYVVGVLDADGVLVTRNVTQGAGETQSITCASLGFVPDVDSIFQLAKVTPTSAALYPELFRVLGVVMKDESSVEITALKYNVSLYDFIDFDHPIIEPPTSQLPPAGSVLPPTNLQIETILVIRPDHTMRQDLEIAWDESPDPYLARYRPTYRRNNGNWYGTHGQLDTDVCSIRLMNVQPGEYEVAIYAINTIGAMSVPLQDDHTVNPPATNITGVTRLHIFGGNVFVDGRAIFQTRDCHFVWEGTAGSSANGSQPNFMEGPMSVGVPDPMASRFHVEIYNEDDKIWEDETTSSEYTFTWDRNKESVERFYGTGFGALRIFRIEVRLVFTDQTLSAPARLTVENPPPPPPQNVITQVGNGFVSFQWDPPSAPDIDYYALFASLEHDDDNPPKVAEWRGTGGTYWPPTTDTYFYWVGAVDSFGNVSANVPQGPPPSGIILPPRFDPPPGAYEVSRWVEISSTQGDVDLYYALTPLGQNPATFLPYPGGNGIWIHGRKTLFGVAQQNHPPYETAVAAGNYYMDGLPPNPAPINDNFASAATLSGNTGGPVYGTTVGATRQTGEPGTEENTVWYNWTPSTTGDGRIWIGMDWLNIHVYTGSGFPLTQVASSTTGSVTWSVTSGTTYRIRLSKRLRVSDFNLRWQVALTSTPANNDLANATNLGNGASGESHGTTVSATTQANEVNPESSTNSVWYSWTAPYARDTQFSVSFPAESRVDIYTGTGHPLTTIANDADAASEGVARWTSVAGQNYKIRVSKRASGTARPFWLRWTQIVPPPNDAFANAIQISGYQGGPINGTTVGATRQAGEPAGDNSVWYKWDTVTAGKYIVFYVPNGVVEVYTGSAVNSLTLVANSDQGIAALLSAASTTYRIRVISSGIGAAFTLYWYTPKVSRVVFDPVPGFYQVEFMHRLHVDFATETQGAYLYWAYGRDPTIGDNDGFVPRSSHYLDLADGSYDLRVLATKQGYLDSEIAVDGYLINEILGPPCDQPYTDPTPGRYAFPLTVQVKCDDPPNAVIKYTTNGLIPSRVGVGTVVANNAYIQLTSPCYLKMIAYSRGNETSRIFIGRFQLVRPAPPPTFTPAAGQYFTFPMDVTIRALAGLTVRYTLDGTIPTDRYGLLLGGNEGVVSIPTAGTQLRAIAYGGTTFTPSPVTSGLYTGRIATPTHTPDSSYYAPATELQVAIDCETTSVLTSGRYTLDGTTPSRTNGILINSFPANVVISGGYRELRSIAFASLSGSGWDDSAIKLSTYNWFASPD